MSNYCHALSTALIIVQRVYVEEIKGVLGTLQTDMQSSCWIVEVSEKILLGS